MARMESTVTIARPVEEVFAFFLALDENAARVDPSATSVVKTPDGPAQAGTTFRFRQKNLIGPMRPKCALTFDQTHEGTKVTFRGDSIPVGPFKFLSPLLNRKGQQVWSQRLTRTKTVLEASAP